MQTVLIAIVFMAWYSNGIVNDLNTRESELILLQCPLFSLLSLHDSWSVQAFVWIGMVSFIIVQFSASCAYLSTMMSHFETLNMKSKPHPAVE
jgi:hypothetical protein